MAWQRQGMVMAATVVCLAALLGACQRIVTDRTAGHGARTRQQAPVTEQALVVTQSTQTAARHTLPADIASYAQALSGDGNPMDILAAQFRSCTTFAEKRRATTALINSLSTSNECVASVMLLLEQAGTPRERAMAQRDLGYVFLRFKDYHASTCAFVRMLSETSAGGDDHADLRYGAHVGLAMAEAHAGNYTAQLRHTQEALMEAGKTGNRRCLDAARDEMAMALINTKEFDAALEYINQRLQDEPGNEFVKMLKEDAEKRRSPIILRF